MVSNKTMICAAILFLIALSYFTEGVMADPIGEVHIVGKTWWEFQWVCSLDELIALDTADNTVYFTWTYAPAPPINNHRRGYFNSYNPQTGLAYGDTGRWMYPGVSNEDYHTLMLKRHTGGLGDLEFGFESINPYLESMRGWCDEDTFCSLPLDTIAYPYEFRDMHACSPSGKIHILGYDFSNHVMYWSSYQPDPYTFLGWQEIDSISSPIYNIACSPVSEKVTICYQRVRPIYSNPHHYGAYLDLDLKVIQSGDGINWDRSDIRNITHFATNDPFRPLNDMDILSDHNNRIHLAFTSQEVSLDSLYPSNDRVDKFMAYIWHWDEERDSFTVIADGWIPDPPRYQCVFSLRWPVCRVQLAENPNNGYLYAIYERYSPYDCSYSPYYPNCDLWVSVSTDGGLNWSVGTNITDTHAPGCMPGECWSEMQPSINDLVNDTLHIAYILDKDAAITFLDELWMREAKVVYQKIPANMIATTPLIHQFSIRQGPVRCHYVTGDINGDGQRNGSDVVYAVNYFKGGNSPSVECDCPNLSAPFYGGADVNGSCLFNGLDITFYVRYLKGLQPRLLFCQDCPPDAI